MYYRLYDTDTRDYKHTGYNDSSLNDLMKSFLSYIGPSLDPSDPDDVSSWQKASTCPQDQIIPTIESFGFMVEQQTTPFESLY